MIAELLMIQLKRLKRHKLLHLYFVIMAALVISNAFQCTGSSTNTGMEYYAGGRFTILCMQSYIDIIGPLFLGFICAVLISGERASGMLKQPLLHGVSRKQLLVAKLVGIFIVAFICFLFVVMFSAGVGFCFWGKQIFDHVPKCFLQIVLLTVTQITMVLFLVFLSLHMKNISSMICASLIILLINNLCSQFFGKYLLYVNFMYYLYAFSEYNGRMLSEETIILGCVVNLATGIVLACSTARRIKGMMI